MKAVIVEIRGNHAAALSDDGIVRQLKNRQYAVGQEILIGGQTCPKTALIRRSACVAAIVIILGTSAWAYYTPYSYVSLDVNPSLEYTVNRFDRVLNCSAVNGDGADIVDSLRLNHKNIQDAVSETIQKIEDDGYFNEKEADIMIASCSKSDQKAEELARNLKKTVSEDVDKDNLNVSLDAVVVEQKYVQQAKELGVTPGKLVLVNKLQDSGSKLSREEIKTWLDSPVKDLMKQIQENKKEEKTTTPNGQGKDDQKFSTPANSGNNGKSKTAKSGSKDNSAESESGNDGTKETKGNDASKDGKASNRNNK